MGKNKTVVGIISDTHGLLRESAVRQLKGSDLIVHAGDFDTPDVLDALRRIAPLVCARGNMDAGEWSAGLPQYDITEIAGETICVIHDVYQLDLEPGAAGITAVVSGHTHRPAIVRQQDILYINPGSAGYQRPGKPVTIGKLILENGVLNPEIVSLDD